MLTCCNSKTFSFKTRCFLLVATLGAGLGSLSPVFADSVIIDLNSRKVTDLGSLGGGDTIARAINESGQVVGMSRTSANYPSPFITGPNGVGMTEIRTPGEFIDVTGINNRGQVIGRSITQKQGGYSAHAFITGPNGAGMTDIGTSGGIGSEATAINNAGQVVGNYFTPPILEISGARDITHAFITGPNGLGMTDLGKLGPEMISTADGINDAGQVVGSHFTPPTAGVLWNPNTFITDASGLEMTKLGIPGSSYYIYAKDINATGQVVGESYTGEMHAFITGPNGTGFTDIDRLSGYRDSTSVDAVNDAGQVVGSFYDYTEYPGAPSVVSQHAFVTGPNGEDMIDLNSLVNLPEHMVLTEATAINNRGQVLALWEKIIPPPPLSPIPEPKSYALMLVGLCLLSFVARCRKNV